MRRTRGYRGFGPIAPDEIQLAQKLGLAGLVMPGALAWDCYPHDAISTPIDSNAVADTDGSAASMIDAGAIREPYYVTHITAQVGTSGVRTRWTVRESATPRRIVRGMSIDDTSNVAYVTPVYPPYRMAAGAETQLILATNAGTQTADTYLQILLGTPQVWPLALNQAKPQSSVVVPADGDIEIIAGETPTAQLPASWGAYTEVLAPLASAAVVTALMFVRKDASDVRVAFATGDEGEEVVWGIFGIPAGTDATKATLLFSLWPFALYLPPATRVAARSQYLAIDGAAVNVLTSLTYVPLL